MDILNEIEDYVEETPQTREELIEEIKQDEETLKQLRELSDSMHYPQIDYQQKRVHEYFIHDQKKRNKKKPSKNKKAMIKASRKKNRKK